MISYENLTDIWNWKKMIALFMEFIKFHTFYLSCYKNGGNKKTSFVSSAKPKQLKHMEEVGYNLLGVSSSIISLMWDPP